MELTDSRTTITLAELTSTNSTGNGLVIANAQNPSAVTIAGGSITGVQGTGVLITDSNISFTYGGTVNKAVGFGQRTIRVENLNAASVLTFSGAVTCTVGTGIDMDNADGTVNFNGALTLNGNECGFNIRNGSDGVFNLANATIQNAQNSLFTINGSAARVTYTGTLNKTQFGHALDISGLFAGGFFNMTAGSTLTVTSGTGIRIANTQGTVTIPSATIGSTANRVDGIGVEITNSFNGTVTFGNLEAYTDGGRAVSSNSTNLIINGGVLDTTNETALFTNLGTLNATLTRISASNASFGIRIGETTGAGLTVTGTGTTAGSGGTISNTLAGISVFSNTGANFSFSNMILNDANTSGTCEVTSCTAAISINGATSLTLDNVDINRTQATGVYAGSVSTVTVRNSRMTNIGYHFAAGTPTLFTAAIYTRFNPTLVVRDNSFTGLAKQGVILTHGTSVNVRDNTFAPRVACDGDICDAYALYAVGNSAANVAFVSNTVNGLWNGLFTQTNGINLDVIGNTITLANDNGIGMYINIRGTSSAYVVNNTVTGGDVSVLYDHDNTAVNMRLLLDNNTLSPAGQRAVSGVHLQGSAARVRVTNNTIGSQKSMFFQSRGNTNPQYDIRNNSYTLAHSGAAATNNLLLSVPGGGSAICATVEDNVFNGSISDNVVLSFPLFFVPGTITLPFAPAYANASAYLIGENTNANPFIGVSTVSGTCAYAGIPTAPVSGLN